MSSTEQGKFSSADYNKNTNKNATGYPKVVVCKPNPEYKELVWGRQYTAYGENTLHCGTSYYLVDTSKFNSAPKIGVYEKSSFENPIEVGGAGMREELGNKFDAGKTDFSLLIEGMPGALKMVTEVLEFGAKKYEPHSWVDVPNAKERYRKAMYRHLMALADDEVLDEESGLSHLAHAATNILFLLELGRDKAE